MLLSDTILPSSDLCHLLHLFHFCPPSPRPFSTFFSFQEDSERYSHHSHAQAVCIPASFPCHLFPLMSFNSLTSKNWKEPHIRMNSLSWALRRCCAQVMTSSCFSNLAVCTITLNIWLRFPSSQVMLVKVKLRQHDWLCCLTDPWLFIWKAFQFGRSWSRSEQVFWRSNVLKVAKPFSVASTSSPRWEWIFALQPHCYITVADLQYIINSLVLFIACFNVVRRRCQNHKNQSISKNCNVFCFSSG